MNNITHEFQTPLATMDIAIKTLQRKNTQMNEANYQNTLAMIERQNERLQKLFRQVTEASVTPVVNKDVVTVSCASIQEMIDDFKLSKPDVSIQCSSLNDAITVSMDPFHLNTILVNLLDNAVKYGADDILIELKASQEILFFWLKTMAKGFLLKSRLRFLISFIRWKKAISIMLRALAWVYFIAGNW